MATYCYVKYNHPSRTITHRRLLNSQSEILYEDMHMSFIEWKIICGAMGFAINAGGIIRITRQNEAVALWHLIKHDKYIQVCC